MYIRALVVFVACMAASLSAQETRGTIHGVIRDPHAASVVGAKVTVTNVETNATVQLVSNNTGYYEASLLIPGAYRVDAEAEGFKKSVRNGVTLPISGRVEVEHTLAIGATTESVTVTGDAPLLDTNAVSSGRVLSQRDISDLPVAGNNIMLLARLAPGVQSTGITRYVAQGYVNGSSEFFQPGGLGGNEYSLDGISNNGNDRRVANTPPADSIEEFKIETSNFDASIGHTIGLNVTMMSKGGANAYHGSASDQFWNQNWNAAGFFQKQTYYRNIAAANARGDTAGAAALAAKPILPPGHSNNFSATFSGPLTIPKVVSGRDKLFFFFSYSTIDDRRVADSSTINSTVPTQAQREGNFSDLLQVDATRFQIYDPASVIADPARPTHYIRAPFAGNIIPKSRLVNPAYDFYTKRIPLPNANPLSPNLEPTNNYIASSQPTWVDYTGLSNRIDYNASGKHRLFFRWSYSDFLEDVDDWTYAVERGLNSNDNVRKTLAGTFDWTWARSASTVINASVGANQYSEIFLSEGLRAYKPSDAGLPKYMGDRCLAFDNCMLPRMNITGYRAIGRTFDSWTRARTMNAKAGITHVRSRHSLTAGLDLRGHFATDGPGGWTGGDFSFNNSYVRRNDDTFTPAGDTGLTWAAFMLGVPSGINIDTQDSYATFNPYYAGYVQDTWRITDRFTLNLGLRSEFEGGPTERYNRALTYLDPNTKLPITDAALAAYARNPIPELPVNQFQVLGGPVYAGANGVSQKWWQNELMWLPRASAAWQVRRSTVIRGGYGIFYDTLNVLNEGANQSGYSRGTSTPISTDFGVNWNVGNPGAGISALSDPFPVRSDGTRFNVPYGSALGAMTTAGSGLGYTGFDRVHPRVHRWRLGVQQQLGASMMFEIAYNGSFAQRANVGVRDSYLSEQYFADGLVRNNANATRMNDNVTNPFYIGNFSSLQTSDPLLYQRMSTANFFTSTTIPRNQLLRPFPHAGTGNNQLTHNQMPLGKVRNHAMELTFTRRMSKGFNLNASYVWMTSDTWNTLLNEYERAPSVWIPSNDARPHRITMSGIYELPFGKNKPYAQSGILMHTLGGWQLSGSWEWQVGSLLNWGNVFYYGDLNTIGEELLKGERTLERWFNTDAPFEKVSNRQPAAYHKRVFPTRVDGLRADGANFISSSVQREFAIRERMRFQIRMDVLNVANRSQFNGPNVDPNNTNFGRVTSQTSSFNRFLQFQGRFRF